MKLTTVHLLRHGEVYNPEKILYGRIPGYRLSEVGQKMAAEVAEKIGDQDIKAVIASPLQRAQETATPLATRLGLPIKTDDRLLESENVFEGKPFGVGDGALRTPAAWRHLWNPFRPSWGEPFQQVAERMWAAVTSARDEVTGHQAVLVSHQMPIWVCRLYAEGTRLWHDPRKRQCTVGSLTSFEFSGAELVRVSYAEPVGHLLSAADRRAPFSAGGAAE